MKISAYIPCYNAAKYLPATIEALLNQTVPPAELLLIDDGSTDNTREVAAKYPVRVLRHEQNRGLAAARNTAFAGANCEFVAAMDADVVADKDWLERLAENFSDDRVAGCGGRLLETHRETAADGWRALHMSQDLGETRIEMAGDSPKRLGGFGSIYRRSAVQRAGGYDERFRTNFEDVDLCERLLRGGYKLIFDPRAIARHARRDTLLSIMRTSWRWEFWSHYRRGGYNNIALKILLNFRFARVLVWRHLALGRASLLGVDCLLPWFHSYSDLGYFFSRTRLPQVTPVPGASDLYYPWPFRGSMRRQEPGK